MAQDNQTRFSRILKAMREEVDWEMEKERRIFFRLICPLIENWQGEFPNLKSIFCPEEIDWLLTQDVKKAVGLTEIGHFTDFVNQTGYKDEPDLDEDGKPSSRRTTPLHHAARCSIPELIGELFEIYDRFDVNYTDEYGLTHFHVACMSEHAEIVKKFLELGQDPNCLPQKSNGSPIDPPLFYALKYYRLDIIECLLRNGADPNLVNAKGLTPLHVMCKEGHEYFMVNPFFEICSEIQQTVQINARDKLGNTALHFATNYAEDDVIELLLKNGADPNPINAKGLTPLHSICSLRERNDFAEYSKKTNKTEDNLSCSRLQWVMIFNRKEKVEVLLRNGADPNLTNADGETPLHIICKRGNDDDLVVLFFEINDDMKQTVQVDSVDNLGWTPLQWAVTNLLPNTVDVLLDRGADLSNFVFPTEGDFNKRFQLEFEYLSLTLKLRLASGALGVVERLKKRGYELNQNDVLVIIKLFDEYGLFEKLANVDECWYDDEEFAKTAKKIMICRVVKEDLSLYDLIRLRPEKAEKLVTHMEYFKLGHSTELWKLPDRHRKTCVQHLCEKMSRRFFRRWALDPLVELTRYRLPILSCDIITENLKNEDLWRICLAATGKNS